MAMIHRRGAAEAIQEMCDDRGGMDLTAVCSPKLPLRYGTDSCYITLADSRYTKDIVDLRNTPSLGKYINYVELSRVGHEQWLADQIAREDALNFVLIANRTFAGTLSLYDIEHGESCEFGRMMMPEDGRRIYALAAELLGMSFAFEILGVKTLYCRVMEGNDAVLHFHLRNGWARDISYDRLSTVNGLQALLIGLSIHRANWPKSFAGMSALAKRLFA